MAINDANRAERKKAYLKEWAKANREYSSQWKKEWYQRNREAVLEQRRKYRAENKQVIKDRKSRYQRERRINDPVYALTHCLRTRLRNAVKRQAGLKSVKSMELLGCSVPDFIIYLESKFEVGMTWDNYGLGEKKWNIDHIIPCSLFDLSKPEHQKRCFHFSNQQPMWSVENSAKSNKVVKDHQFNLL